jgi:hypothetical protein
MQHLFAALVNDPLVCSIAYEVEVIRVVDIWRWTSFVFLAL